MKYFKGLFLNTMREFMQLKSKILLLIVNFKNDCNKLSSRTSS